MEHKASVRFAFEARAQSVRTASDFACGRLQRSNKQHADILEKITDTFLSHYF